jgi:predicted transcriptional regulator
MIRRASKKQVPVAIHSRLDPAEHQRLAEFAERQNSSVARIIKLAVMDYINRQSGRPDQTNKQG